MDEKKHSIDDEQLDRFLKAFEPPKQGAVPLETILKLAQVLAIVISGAWVFVKFLDHGRETAQISMNRDQIALRQAEISLETIERRTELSDIEYEQTVALTKLEVERLELQNKINEVELEASTGRIFDYSYHLKISAGKLDGSAEFAKYNAEFRVGVTNKSDENLSVDSIVIDTFRFSGNEGHPSITKTKITPISPIPRFHLVDDEISEGRIVDGWEFIGREVFLNAGSTSSVRDFLKIYGVDLSTAYSSGSMLGVWRPGETTYFRKDYVIQGRPGDYIGFIATICFNQCRENGLWNFPASKTLPLIEASSQLLDDSSKSPETEN